MKLITFEGFENLMIKKEQKTTIYVLGLITIHLFSVSYFPNCRVHTNFGSQPTIITTHTHPTFKPCACFLFEIDFFLGNSIYLKNLI